MLRGSNKSKASASRSGLSIDESMIAFACVKRRDDGTLRLSAAILYHDANNKKWAHRLAARMENIVPARSKVTSVLPDGSYQLLLVEVPNVPADEINSAARWQIKDLLDFPVENSVVELFEMPEQSTADRKSMAYAVATRRSSVQEHIELLQGAGFSLDVIDIPELCTRNIAIMLPQDASGVAFLYLTETHGILTVTRQGVLYLIRRIEKGLRAINSAPTDDSAATEQESDAVLELQSSPGDYEGNSGFIGNFTRAELVSSIALEIKRSLDYYESHFGCGPPTELVLAPGSDIGGLAKSLNEQLDLTVSNLDLNKLFKMQTPLSPVEQGACLLAVGAALRSEPRAA